MGPFFQFRRLKEGGTGDNKLGIILATSSWDVRHSKSPLLFLSGKMKENYGTCCLLVITVVDSLRSLVDSGKAEYLSRISRRGTPDPKTSPETRLLLTPILDVHDY